MNIYLYISAYNEQNLARRKELIECFSRNTEAGFKIIHVLSEGHDCLLDHARKFGACNPIQTLFRYPVIGRPTVQQYIDMANLIEADDPDSLHIIANSDIFFIPETLEQLRSLPWDQKLFVALSRYDVTSGGAHVLLDRWDSQDTFVWRGECNVRDADCPLGFAGSDNSLCWKFKAAGYKVVNPSRDIKTMHLHLVQVNNYREGGNNRNAVKADHICPEPYHLVTPCKISEI